MNNGGNAPQATVSTQTSVPLPADQFASSAGSPGEIQVSSHSSQPLESESVPPSTESPQSQPVHNTNSATAPLMMEWDPVAGMQAVADQNQTNNAVMKAVAAMNAENRDTAAKLYELNQTTNNSILEIYGNLHANRLRSAARGHALFIEMLNYSSDDK